MKRLLFMFCSIFGLITILLCGCTSEESIDSDDQGDQDDEDQGIAYEDPPATPEKEAYSYPLTGEMTDQLEAIHKRPVAVMVNNDPEARPQSGLSKADVVYEVLAEGAITRFLAIYQSDQAEMIGPVRSARDYFVRLAQGYGAFYVAHGWSPKAKELLTSGTMDHINGMAYDGTLFERVSFRQAPHDSYITFASILKGAEQNGDDMTSDTPPLPFLTESDIDSIAAEKANEITINYQDRYSVTYQYEQATEKYTRFSDGEQTVDYETETPIELDNVLIVETDHHVVDDIGRRDIDLTSGGNALLLQKGTIQLIEWENDNGRIVPKGLDEQVGFVPGQTWINLIPRNPGIERGVSYELNRN